MSKPQDQTTDAETFVRQCGEAGERITDLLFSYPKHVAVCVLPGVLASTIKALGIPRDAAVAMLDSALEDIESSTNAE